MGTVGGHRGVAVITLPGEVGGLELPHQVHVPRFVTDMTLPTSSAESIDAVAAAVNKADKVAARVSR